MSLNEGTVQSSYVNVSTSIKGPIHDQSCCAKMFCPTQVCPFTINHVAQKCFVQHKFAHSRSIMLRKNVCATQVCPFTINHVAQKCFVQHKFAHSRSIIYATDCANCQLAPYMVNQLHNTQCCAT
jgi:hypothetical protein